MRKRLSRIGNSLALVLDAPIRRQLGIGANTIVKLSTDGKCLFVEPLPPGAEPPRQTLALTPELALERDAPRAIDGLLAHGLSQERFAKLAPNYGRMGSYIGWVKNWDLRKATLEQRLIMARVQKCYEELQAGKSWEDAIQSSTSAGFFS